MMWKGCWWVRIFIWTPVLPWDGSAGSKFCGSSGITDRTESLPFGTDSPWDDQQSAVSAVKDLPIDASLKDKILYENAAGLLKLE